MLGPLKAMACALFNLGQAVTWLLQEQRYQSISQYFNQSINQSINQSVNNLTISQSANQSFIQLINQPTNRSINHALWVYRLQPPEPASKDAIFKPGASTWNTDDPKQQHHAPGMQLWLAPWHATLACNMACNSGLHQGMQVWLATWHATLACTRACNSGLQHGMQLAKYMQMCMPF